MEVDRTQDLLRFGGRHLRAAAAVHMKIHESGQHVVAREVVRRIRGTRRIADPDRVDVPIREADPARFQDSPWSHHPCVRENGH
jgi:hypothetical protein